MSMFYWFAVMSDDEHDDWSEGSYNLNQAVTMMGDYPEGYIAVINVETDFCVDELRRDEKGHLYCVDNYDSDLALAVYKLEACPWKLK